MVVFLGIKEILIFLFAARKSKKMLSKKMQSSHYALSENSHVHPFLFSTI